MDPCSKLKRRRETAVSVWARLQHTLHSWKSLGTIGAYTQAANWEEALENCWRGLLADLDASNKHAGPDIQPKGRIWSVKSILLKKALVSNKIGGILLERTKNDNLMREWCFSICLVGQDYIYTWLRQQYRKLFEGSSFPSSFQCFRIWAPFH